MKTSPQKPPQNWIVRYPTVPLFLTRLSAEDPIKLTNQLQFQLLPIPPITITDFMKQLWFWYDAARQESSINIVWLFSDNSANIGQSQGCF